MDVERAFFSFLFNIFVMFQLQWSFNIILVLSIKYSEWLDIYVTYEGIPR